MFFIVSFINIFFTVTAAAAQNISCISKGIKQTVLFIKICMRSLCPLLFLIASVYPLVLPVQAPKGKACPFSYA